VLLAVAQSELNLLLQRAQLHIPDTTLGGVGVGGVLGMR
jgi:hypothetical protein